MPVMTSRARSIIAANGPAARLAVRDSTPACGCVGAVDSANHVSSPSQPDLATTIVFTDEPLAAGTIVKALHFTELRTAIDAVRAAIGSGPATYTNAITMGGVIKAIDVTEMRSFLDSARSALFVPGVQYTDPSLNAGTTIIRAAHLQELRNGVK